MTADRHTVTVDVDGYTFTDVAHAPDAAVSFVDLYAARRFNRWQPLGTLVLGGAATGFAYTTIVMVLVLIPALSLSSDSGASLDVFLDRLVYAAGIIGALIAIRIGMGVRPEFAVNLTGRLRLRLFAVMLAIAVVVTGGLVLAIAAVSGWGPQLQADSAGLVLAYVIGAPVQCAGEELVLRGFAQQSIGSWFGNRRTAVMVSTAITAVAFAALHAPDYIGGFVALIVFGVVLSAVTYVSGGLEASIALHIALTVFVDVIGSTQHHSLDIVPTFGNPFWSITGIIVPVLAGAGCMIAWLRRRPVDRMRIWAAEQQTHG